ncbi:hypothetical protein HMPREF0580_1994 [Mobiluncus mulieris ATCC 35239]|uniref:Uncharacterized protein n=2 Tax=Mobiluncus mulieris TaxID=2052 RepID=E0QSW6_9ACTO|nr:hypothetical protein HMPREF0577_1354 [Mobiluncus mulieris ATCC 35243]EFM45305.1 hypothetical protein HMPREF0580_1994 [Mobiluncus mulieris ATCC 35239]MCU9971397.1 hypothetical protein [Mobiluncus mulieris]MCV0014043.1 hypothetical protein [Mobiluncus mulieris]NMW63216.1 hypothetical protein [Mobiluncus mulieris]
MIREQFQVYPKYSLKPEIFRVYLDYSRGDMCHRSEVGKRLMNPKNRGEVGNAARPRVDERRIG